MCHGHPRHHSCGHQSVTWHYCPKALIDLETGYETACDKTTFASSQPSKHKCPLGNCQFKTHGGSWTCCVCKQGPNTQGWCKFDRPRWEKNPITNEFDLVETCDHGCCKNCTGDTPANSTEDVAPKSDRKHQTSRKNGRSAGDSSQKKGSGQSDTNIVASVEEDYIIEALPSLAPASGPDDASYDIQLDYGLKKSKASQKKKGRRSAGQ